VIRHADPRREWQAEFEALAARLRAALGPRIRVDHVGSTAVPGLLAKDVVGAQVIVQSLEPRDTNVKALIPAGFEPRQGAWNMRDQLPAGWRGSAEAWDKLVFRSEAGEHPGNVHVRRAGSPNERYALLFRDFLRADVNARDT